MASVDTVLSIFKNVEKVLRAKGIKFVAQENLKPEDIPAAQMPAGFVDYDGEIFEYTTGMALGYAEVRCFIEIYIIGASVTARTDQIRWLHKLKTALTVNALNVGDLETSKKVSRVDPGTPTVERLSPTLRVVRATVEVRYEES
jgi:hypothetical protein